jgi:4-amino-4-deoxy-L-arabinose transferase-like glycosyltransferase
MKTTNNHILCGLAVIIGFILVIVISGLYVVYGQTNADEGWYLYASKLVYNGQHPYQDFAYTQTPLLPYIYGIPQKLFFPSIYLGRITSVILSIISLILSLSIARRLGGEKAAAVTSLLWASFTTGIYFQSIVKTYALTTFFLMLAFFMLSINGRKEIKYILATIFVLLATLTRLSALFFAIPLIIYSFVVSNGKSKIIITAACLAAVAWVIQLAAPNMEAAYWGLLGNHLSQWESATIIEKVSIIVKNRTPKLLRRFPNYFLLWAGILLLGYKRILTYLKNNATVLVTVIGLLMFVVPNLTSGFMFPEYFVPFIFMLYPIAGIFIEKTILDRERYKTVILLVIVSATIIFGLTWRSASFIDLSGGQLPIEEIKKISSVVAENTDPTDRVYALEALSVVFEADRYAMPNMSMAQFTFFNGDTTTADQLHLVNGQMTLSYFDNRTPKMILLTGFDWNTLRKIGEYEQIVASINKNYQLIYNEKNFGQNNSRIEVYLVREDK